MHFGKSYTDPMPISPSFHLSLPTIEALVAVGPRPVSVRPLAKALGKQVALGVALALGLATPSPSAAATPAALQVAPSPAQATLFDPFQAIPQPQRPAGLYPTTGGLSAWALVEQWKTQGIAGPQREELVRVLVATQSPSLVSGEGARRARALSDRTRAVFAVSSQDQAAAFLASSGLDVLVREGLLPKGAFPSAAADRAQEGGISTTYSAQLDPEAAATWSISSYFSSLSRAQSVEFGTHYYPDTRSPQEHGAAVERLSQVASRAGIERLIVPLPLWSSASALTQLADNVELQARRLEIITGWSGGVMGLRGHIDWFMGSPDLTGTTFRQADGTALVTGHPEMATHEWLHGLENLLAVRTGLSIHADNDHSILASEHIGEEVIRQQAWHSPLSELIRVATAIPAREGQEDGYWQKPSERLAYLFDSYLTDRANRNGLRPADPLWVADPTANGPSWESARASEGAWTQFFKASASVYNQLPASRFRVDTSSFVAPGSLPSRPARP